MLQNHLCTLVQKIGRGYEIFRPFGPLFFKSYLFCREKNPQHAFLRRGSKAVGPMS